MNNNRLVTLRHMAAVLMLIAALVAVVGCSDGNGDTPPPPTTPDEIGLMEVEVRAPDFTLATVDGSQMTLADLQGQIVLLNFWQLDCPPCKEEMPYLDAAGKAFVGTAHVVVVNIQDSESAVQDYFGDSELNMIVPLDITGFVASQYSIGFTPTTFLIDSEGMIRFAKVGPFNNYGELAAAIEFARLKDAE
jgi:peroxiredoxin